VNQPATRRINPRKEFCRGFTVVASIAQCSSARRCSALFIDHLEAISNNFKMRHNVVGEDAHGLQWMDARLNREARERGVHFGLSFTVKRPKKAGKKTNMAAKMPSSVFFPFRVVTLRSSVHDFSAARQLRLVLYLKSIRKLRRVS
jgi:hypothetical protein